MGKWSGLKKTLERVPEDPSWQQKIDLVKATLPTTIKELGEVYLAFRAQKEELEAQAKELNITVEAAQQALVSLLEEQGLPKVTLEDGHTLSINDDVYTKVEDKVAFLQWLDENDLNDLLTVHYQTMNGLVKERFESKPPKPVPPGLKAFIKSGIRRTKPRS